MPRSRPSSRRSARPLSSKERENRKALLISCSIFFVVAALGGAIAGYQILNPKPKIDQATYCPVAGPSSVTAIVIDATDSINAVQKIAINNEINRLREGIPRFGALAIYSAGFDGQLSRPEFMLCNPGSVRDMDWLTEGKLRVEKHWKEGFDAPLDAVLEKLLVTKPAAKTPLLEAIQSVSVQSFGPIRSAGRTVPLQLVIVSDLLQHSDSLDLYRPAPKASEFAKTEQYRKIRADLKSVSVDLLFIRRVTKHGQGKDLTDFWQDLVSIEGGTVTHFKPLEG